MDPAQDLSTPQKLQNNYINKKPIIIAMTVALILVVAAVGFFSNILTIPTFKQTSEPTKNQSQPMLEDKITVTDQTAVVVGTISKVGSNSVTIKDKLGKESSFSLSSRLTIYKQSLSVNKQNPNLGVATRSAELNAIELNKEASIILKVEGGEYKVFSISYLSPPPVN